MQEDIKTFMTQKEALELQVKKLRVTNELERFAAAEFLSHTLIPLRKIIEGKRQAFSLRLRQIASQWDGEFLPARDAVDGQIAYVKQMILEYQLKLERVQRERQAQLDRKAEAEREAERKAAAAQNALKPSPARPQIPEVITALAPQPEQTIRTASGTTTVRKVPVVVIFDESLIPRKYLEVNRRLLDQDVKAGVVVPGARLESRPELAVRAR